MKSKRKSFQNKELIGKTKAKIIKILGDDYTMDSDGNMVYVTGKIFLFKQTIQIGFNQQQISDSLHIIG